MKVKNLKISDFRWFDGDYLFDLSGRESSPSDIILIYAPNGSGKTSVTEAFEWLFTGEIDRIGSLLNEYSKKPREGYILKNRNSTSAEVGCVELTLEDATGKTSLRRTTLPLKNKRVNDYGLGNLDPKFVDPARINGKRICDYILSQSKVNEFLFAASSGELFENYMSLSGRKEDLSFYYSLVDARERISTNLANLKKIEIATQQEYAELVVKRDALLEKALDDIRPQFDVFVNAFPDLVDRDFYRISRDSLPDAISGAKTILNSLRKEVLGFQASLDVVRANAKSFRLLKRRIKYCNSLQSNRNACHEASRHLRALEEKSNSIKDFSVLAKTDAVLNMLARIEEISSAKKILDVKLMRVKGIIDIRTASYEDCRRLTDEVSKRLSQLRLSRIQLNEVKNGLGLASVTTEELEGRIEAAKNLLRKHNEVLDLAKQRDFTVIPSELWQNFGLHDLMMSLTLIASDILEKERLINEVDKSIVDAANLAERISAIKLDSLKVVQEHSSDSCPVCSHNFESNSALVQAILQTSSLSDIFSDRKDLLVSERTKLLQQKTELDEKIRSQLENVAKAAQLASSEQNDQILKLQQALLDLRKVESELAKNYLLKADKGMIVPVIEEAILGHGSHLSMLRRRSSIHISQLRRASLIESLFSNHIAELDIETSEILKRPESSGYFELLSRLRDRWEIYPENLQRIQVETEIEIVSIGDKIADLESSLTTLRSTFADVVMFGNEVDPVGRAEFSVLDGHYINCKRDLGLIQNKVVGLSVFNLARVILRFDQALLSCASLETLLEHNNEILRISNRILEIEPTLAANKENSGSMNSNIAELDLALAYSNEYFQSIVKNATSVTLLNDIYRLIDPNLSYHRIEFDLDMTRGKEGLFIKSGPASDRIARGERVEGNELVSPALFFSEAQSNVLSISLFLTKIAASQENLFDFLIMDDPIQSMDDINAYAFIDMCRIFTAKFDKQIIITTHDVGFFNLFKKRFPENLFNFKYFSIESGIKNYV